MERVDSISVKAKLYLKTNDEGGRKNPIGNHYRPNHVFEIKDGQIFPHTFIGEINFEEELMQLGETKIVTVVFMKYGGIEKYLTVGKRWFIYEAGRPVGEAEIIAM